MQFYKKQITPIVQFAAYLEYREYPMYKDMWFDEDEAEVLKDVWEEELSNGEELVLKERYIEVDLPEIEVTDIKPGNILGLKFDTSQIGLDTVETYMHKLAEVAPDNLIIVLPNGEFEAIEDRDAALMILEHYIDAIKRNSRRVNYVPEK